MKTKEEELQNLPETIFIVLGENEENLTDFNQFDHEFVFWTTQRNFKNDIEYIRKNKLDLITRQLHETQKEVLRLRACPSNAYSEEHVKRAIEMARETAIELNGDQCYENDEDYILQSLSPSLKPVETKQTNSPEFGKATFAPTSSITITKKQEPATIIYINDNTISASKPVVVKTDTEGYVAGGNVSLSNKVEVKEKYCECITKTDITIVNGKHICHTCNKPLF